MLILKDAGNKYFKDLDFLNTQIDYDILKMILYVAIPGREREKWLEKYSTLEN